MVAVQYSAKDRILRWLAVLAMILCPIPAGVRGKSHATVPPAVQGYYQVRGTVRVGTNPVGVVTGSGGIFVANYGSASVSKVDVTSLKVTATIPVGRAPYGVARMVRSEAQYVSLIFVTNQQDNTLSVIEDYANRVTTTIPVGRLPHGVATTVPATSKVYIANAGDNSVTVINQRTLKAVATIREGIGSFPTAVAARWDPSTMRSYIFVTNTGSNTISVIDSTTDRVASVINTFTNYPIGAAAVHSIPRAFVANQKINTVSEIDGVSHKVLSTVAVGAQPIGLAVRYPVPGEVSSGRFDIIVANSADNTVSVLQRDLRRNGQTVKTVRVGNGPIGVDASGTYVSVTNFRDNTVTILY